MQKNGGGAANLRSQNAWLFQLFLKKNEFSFLAG
jgi:hypothetical protein